MDGAAGGTAADRAGHVTDEVDQLVEEWHAQRPDLDVAPLQVLSRIWRLARHLDRARADAFAGQGLEPWEFDVLSSLRARVRHTSSAREACSGRPWSPPAP